MHLKGGSAIIHPTAVVARGAKLGDGVRIGPYCVVGANVVIEANVELISHVVVDGHTRIGREVVLYPFCSVGLAPQDLKYQGQPTHCEVGERTQVRENCTIHRGSVTGNGVTRIGSDCLLMAIAHIAHDCTLGDHVTVGNNVVMGGHVSIADHAVIGSAAAIHQYVRIGRVALIDGVSGVEADVIPFGSVTGNRARLTGLNITGMNNIGFEKSQVRLLGTVFRTLFASKGVFAQSLATTRMRYSTDPLVAEILSFIDKPSYRGLIRTDFDPLPEEESTTPPEEDEPDEPSFAARTQYEEMLRRIAALEEALANVSPPLSGIGHNNPPEPLEPVPLSLEDQNDLEAAVAILKSQSVQPEAEPTAAIVAANTIASLGQRLKTYAARQGDIFVSEATKAAGSELGKWAVRLPLWALLAERMLALCRAVFEWIAATGFHP
jgi:UDP-N-acetylglucosamine acyltransferase